MQETGFNTRLRRGLDGLEGEGEGEGPLGVLGHQLLVLLPQGVHAVDHLLHQLHLHNQVRWGTRGGEVARRGEDDEK